MEGGARGGAQADRIPSEVRGHKDDRESSGAMGFPWAPKRARLMKDHA